MPRTRRVAPDNTVQHVLNRRNRKETLFESAADYRCFLNLMADGIDRVSMRVLAFCLMPTHWHMVLWPHYGVELSAYIGWLSNAHVRQHHQRHGTMGLGHVYQGRFKNFIIQSDPHMFRVLRYVEANPLRAGLVSAAEQWPWSSLRDVRAPNGGQIISTWPLARPADWLGYVNQGIPEDELATLQHAARRGAPYGDKRWVADAATRHGLKSMLGRPQKREAAAFSAFE